MHAQRTCDFAYFARLLVLLSLVTCGEKPQRSDPIRNDDNSGNVVKNAENSTASEVESPTSKEPRFYTITLTHPRFALGIQADCQLTISRASKANPTTKEISLAQKTSGIRFTVKLLPKQSLEIAIRDKTNPLDQNSICYLDGKYEAEQDPSVALISKFELKNVISTWTTACKKLSPNNFQKTTFEFRNDKSYTISYLSFGPQCNDLLRRDQESGTLSIEEGDLISFNPQTISSTPYTETALTIYSKACTGLKFELNSETDVSKHSCQHRRLGQEMKAHMFVIPSGNNHIIFDYPPVGPVKIASETERNFHFAYKIERK